MFVSKVVFCIVLVEIINGQNIGTRKPNVTATLRALHPRGLRVYITGDVDTNVVIFNGKLYGLMENGIKQVWGTAIKQASGGWLFEDPNLTLNVGSMISYRIFLPDQFTQFLKENDKNSYKLKGFETDILTFQVSVLEDPSAPEPNCVPTRTRVRGRQYVCGGEVIFEDNFDTLREDLWQVEQYIPVDHPDHPFVSFQRLTSDPNVFVENGTLHIVPKLQENLLRGQESILSGNLDLSDGCTRKMCSKKAFGPDILPPIVSGRLTSYLFSFKYGIVYVRAKVPKGDWLYPEILLEPLLTKYGGTFGGKFSLPEILKIALADGNRVNNEDYALVYQIFNRSKLGLGNCGATKTESTTRFNHDFWGDDFHEFALRWTPDEIMLTVDGDKYFYWERPSLCEDITSAFDYLHLTLGVAVGGAGEFPDNSSTDNGKPKPWRNGDPKASLRFWEERHSWLPTWTQPSLIVDYIKVVAL
ncbi:beta-1,3-glucan-binding protein-like isoform X1 [Maniola jurtina]|uniref:beta-1,3-glucan-binding protein-like isoform X1 n=1 Tax=Maniola jurtina TaxID=191418 RepID=UPI001E687F07|nr:beta-1,3-glucan-binding protein-like isoform X1 [Maniola jurtina]